MCALSDDGAAAVPYTGVDICSQGAVYALGDDGVAEVPHTGADTYAWGSCVRTW